MEQFDILLGNCLEILPSLPEASVQCCVTSPPYWGLRDYQTSSWIGGDENCDHVADSSKTKKFGNDAFNENRPSREEIKTAGYYFRDICSKCGAKRSDLQLGLEQTPEEYVANMVLVFREVWRVLRDDGTLWLNLGDSYASIGHKKSNSGYGTSGLSGGIAQKHFPLSHENNGDGLKNKDLVGIPWRVAFALQADGWWLRQDIIWHKPNPMPESVTDRCTKAHEYIFLLTKSARYYYDADAIAEPVAEVSKARVEYGWKCDRVNISPDGNGSIDVDRMGNRWCPKRGRNRRSVWTVTTKPFKGAHFATFPPDLIEPCVLAGSAAKCCAVCGAPWERILKPSVTAHDGKTKSAYPKGTTANRLALLRQAARERGAEYIGGKETIGWRATCSCHADETIPATVLDPFNGAGTTGVVAIQHGRRYIGIELNPDYLEMSRKRIQKTWDGITLPLGL